MTVNVDALINHLGKSYQALIDKELISYKTKPTGYPGDPDKTLDMAKGGAHLTFKRDGRNLWSVILSFQNDNSYSCFFSNKLPEPLKSSMSRAWVHKMLGDPERNSPPEVIMKRTFG